MSERPDESCVPVENAEAQPQATDPNSVQAAADNTSADPASATPETAQQTEVQAEEVPTDVASAVPADAALKAAEVAARLAAEHGSGASQAYPVSSGAEHASEEENSNKRKYDGTEDSDPNKRMYSDPMQQSTNGSSAMNPVTPSSEQAGYSTEEATEVVHCPHALIGRVIGKGGETIRDLQNSSGARIQIDHSGDDGQPRAVTVTGSGQCVAMAKKMILDIIAQGQDPTAGAPGAPSAGEVKQTVNCPPGIVGRVIGRGGETIRALQTSSGAHISIDQNFPEGVDRQVHIQGRPDAVDRGLKMVTELIAGGPGSANDVIQKVIQKHGGGISQTLQCPKTMVGRVIGKGGETIKALQNASGARIQIDQSTEPMTVTITGAPDAVARAEASVTDIINGGSGFLAGQQGYYGAQQAYQAPYGGYGYQAYQAYGAYGAPTAYGGYGGYGQGSYAGFGAGGAGQQGYAGSGGQYSGMGAMQPMQSQFGGDGGQGGMAVRRSGSRRRRRRRECLAGASRPPGPPLLLQLPDWRQPVGEAPRDAVIAGLCAWFSLSLAIALCVLLERF
uniref:Far upstream element-binding protein n=1 Tax=Tetraselmis sp. GSL018 TaxID=582737 RepID=A0A061RZW2_9CHLO